MTLAHSQRSPGHRVEGMDTPRTEPSSPIIPPSGSATIMLGDELTAIGSTPETPLIIGVSESEDVFARELNEMQLRMSSVIGDSTGLSQAQTQLELQNVIESTQVVEERSARIAMTQYRPRRVLKSQNHCDRLNKSLWTQLAHHHLSI